MNKFKAGDSVVIACSYEILSIYNNLSKQKQKFKFNKVYKICSIQDGRFAYLKGFRLPIHFSDLKLHNPVENILQDILDE